MKGTAGISSYKGAPNEKDSLLADVSAGKLNDTKPVLYRGTQHMSSSAFNELVSEIERSKKKLSRSASIDVDMQPSLLNPDRIDSSSRRALYGSLPFTAMFGMQSREQGMKRVLSHVASMESLGPEVGMTLHMTEDGTFVNREGQEAGQHSLQTEKDMDGTALTMPLIMAVIVAVASQFLVGLNTSIMNGGGDVIFQGHSVLLWSVAVASFAVGGPFGAILGGILANEKGRRGTILINAWVYFIGGAAMAIAPNIYWLIPARFMCGFASGLTTVVVPVYLGEIAPPTMRGALGTMSQFAQVIGIFASTMCAIPLLNDRLWRFHFTITPVIAAIQLFISPFLLESPRWLLGRSDRSTHARVVIKHLRGLRTDEEVEAEAQNYIYAHQRFKTQHQSAHSLAAYYDLIQNKSVRLLLSGAVLLQAAQQLCGINAVFYYSTSFFKGTLTDPHIGTAVVAFVNVLATYLALKLMDNTARRTLLLVSAGGMLVSAAVLLPALLGSLPPVTALLAVGGFVFFFEIGLGPIPWLIVAEMFDAKFVATAMSISCIVNWTCNFLVGVSFPILQLALGPYCFVPFMVVLAVTLVYVWTSLPETHGRTLEEVQRLAESASLSIKNISDKARERTRH